MEDGQIIQLLFNRDESAIYEMDVKYGRYCFTVANRILVNDEDSKECVNDTWLHAWNAIPPKRPERLRLFLATIIRNLSFNRYKLRNTKKRGNREIESALEELEECIAGTSMVEEQIECNELKDCINQFLHSLPSRDCDLFLRRYFFVESTKEIAKRYDIKESNVLMILSRTRQKLRQHLLKEGYHV